MDGKVTNLEEVRSIRASFNLHAADTGPAPQGFAGPVVHATTLDAGCRRHLGENKAHSSLPSWF